MAKANDKTLKIWILRLVPSGRFGRWISAAVILLLGLIIYGVAAYSWSRARGDVFRFPSWPTAAFFTCAVAYIVPVFHYITKRSLQTVEGLKPYLPEPVAVQTEKQIEYRSVSWLARSTLAAVVLWLLQSRLLAGSWQNMWDILSYSMLDLCLSIGPLPVWLTMCVAMSALLRNAIYFRDLSKQLNVNIYEPDSFMPIGSMAVTSTLVVLGALGLLSIMWVGGPVNWWTTLPAIAFFSPLLILLLLVPVLPLRRQLVAQKEDAMIAAQAAVREAQRLPSQETVAAMTNALAFRREVARLPSWPFDVPAITRFVSYAIIVPLTWIGAALIEMLVNAVVT